MLACIELILLINLAVFADKNRLNRIAMWMVTLLMVYQALEFFMCGLESDNNSTAFLAFLDITFLPPLNLLLVLVLSGSYNKKFNLVFIPSLFFIIYYASVVEEFTVSDCTVLYASYNYPLGDLYGFFYYLPLIISIILLILFIKKNRDKKERSIALLLLSGNIFISLPVIAGFILNAAGYPALLDIIESIMCKFAVVYAVLLSVVCLQNSVKK